MLGIGPAALVPWHSTAYSEREMVQTSFPGPIPRTLPGGATQVSATPVYPQMPGTAGLATESGTEHVESDEPPHEAVTKTTKRNILM